MTLAFLALAILVAGSLGVSLGASPPPMSEEIVLDHGFRYEYNPSHPERSTVAVGEETVLFAYMDQEGGRGFGSLHNPSGERAGWNPTEFFGYEDHARAFDCSDQDSVGWKIAYVGGVGQFGENRVVRVRNLHPTSLQATGPDLLLAEEVSELRCPLIARYAGGHVVLWIDGTSLWQTRVSADLRGIDGTPRLLSSAAEWAAIATKTSGGIVIWRESGGLLLSMRLDADALPVGRPTAIGSLSHVPLFDVTPLGDGWLAALTNGDELDLYLLDAGGAVTKRALTAHWVDSPVTVCSSDSVGIVLWGDLFCTRIHTTGRLIGDTIRLDELSNVSPYGLMLEGSDPRAFACAWTGESFAMIWHEFAQDVTAKRDVRWPAGPDSAPPGTATAYPDYDDVPVFAQWMSETGQPLLTEPLLASQASVAGGVSPWTKGDRTLVVLRDEASELWLHTLQLDMSGDVVGGPTRIRTPAHEAYCHIWDCEWSGISGIQVRPWGSDIACLYAYASGYSSEYVFINSEELIIDRLSMKGEQVLRVKVPVCSAVNSVASGSADFAAREQDALVVFPTSSSAPVWGCAELLSATGQCIRHWPITCGSEISQIAAAPLATGYLVVWPQSDLDGPVLRTAIVDPSMPEIEITGAPLLGPDWRGWNCTLVPGLEQSLCVFIGRRGNDPSEDRIYAVRLDETGRLLDPKPIRVSGQTCMHCYPDGVWDSNHYFVVWKRWSAGEGSSLHGSRIGRNGVLVDPTPFPLGSSGWEPTVSSDSLGNVTLAYGNRIRMIQDLIPLAPDDPFLPDNESAPTDLWIGAVTPNPTPGDVRLDLRLPWNTEAHVTVHDAAGRRLHATHLIGPLSGAASIWGGRLDGGRRAPAGIYFLRIDAGRQSGTRKAFLLR